MTYFEQFYNLLWYYAMEIINDASWILVRVFLENLSILNIEAENFEAGDFLTIFLTFWGFWGSFSYKNSSYKKNVYSFISAKKIISLTRRYLPVSQLYKFHNCVIIIVTFLRSMLDRIIFWLEIGWTCENDRQLQRALPRDDSRKCLACN